MRKGRKSFDNGGPFGALFTDLSKAFDCLSHKLLIAKLDPYDFNKNALKLVNKKMTKIVNIVDSEMLFGVAQGSI